jgi:hypothetical protein
MVSTINLFSKSDSQAAWQYACTHQSDLSELQQQVLQVVGCSSRASFFAAAHCARTLMDVRIVRAAANTCILLAHAWPVYVDGSRQQELQQFAKALVQYKAAPGDSPPYGSRMLSCAALYWLMPAVLFEWSQKQLASGPNAGFYNRFFSGLWLKGLDIAQTHWNHWATVHKAREAEAERQREGQEQQEGQHDLSESQERQQEQQEGKQHHPVAGSSTLEAASSVAFKLAGCFAPPDTQLVQLLPMVSGAAAHIMSRMQEAPQIPTVDGSSSGHTAGSSGSAAGSRGSASSSSGSGQRGSSTSAQVQQPQLQVELREALVRLSLGVDFLMPSVPYTLAHCVEHTEGLPGVDAATLETSHSSAPSTSSSSSGSNNSTATTTTGSSSSAAQGACNSMPDSGIGRACPAVRDSEQHARLARFCTAWQQNLPQLATLTEAAFRTAVQSEPQIVLRCSLAFRLVRKLCDQGLFVASNLQPSSPALKPLCGLMTTLLKPCSWPPIQSNPAEQEGVQSVVLLLGALRLNSMVLQAACASSSSSSSSSSDAVIGVMSGTKISDKWHPNSLSIIISTTACPAAGSSSSSDAVAMVPWLVSLGRCCTGYALILQQSQAGGAPAWLAGHQLDGQQTLEAMRQALREVVAVLPAWLQSSSVSAQLAAAGYSTQHVLNLLQSAAQALQDALDAGAAAFVSPELMRELGSALFNMPISTACNNLRCSSMAGLSEQQLVVGTARLCAGCRVARYCCRACQVAAWKQHKPACKAVAAARAANPAQQAA